MMHQNNLRDLYGDLQKAFDYSGNRLFLRYRRAIAWLLRLKLVLGYLVLPSCLLWLWQREEIYRLLLLTALAGFSACVLLGVLVTLQAEKACLASLPRSEPFDAL